MRGSLVLVVSVAVFAAPYAHADGEPDGIFAAAQSAVADGRVTKGKALGGNDPKRTVTDLPDKGALLIGFDIGVGKFGDIETVYALRPLYLTADGEESYQNFGLFADHQVSPKKLLKTKVVKKVRLVARPGYAVGAITLRTGLNINGLSVTFLRINGRTLDPNQSYTSEWVGDRTGGGEKTSSANGAPVIGVYGTQDDEHVYGLGLLSISEPPPPKTAPEPPRTERPAAPVAEKPPKRVPATKPPAPVQKEDAPAEVEDEPAPQPAPAPAAAQEPSAWSVWLPFVVFGVVVGLVLGAAVLFHSTNRRGRFTPPDLIHPTPRRSRSITADEDVPTLTAVSEEDGVRTDLPVAPRKPIGLGGRYACPSCRRVVADPAAPWCVLCGADLRDKAPLAAVPETPNEKPFVQPPFFHGKAERTFRIFVLADELLFMDAPAGDDASGTENVVRGVGMMGGLLGAMIGGTVADALAGTRKAAARRRRDDLDRAPTDDLQNMADTERHSFRAEVSRFSEVSLVALSFWQRLFSENGAAHLHFHHLDCGRVTLVLPTPTDVREALEQLTPILGEVLTVNAVWDYGAGRYVPH